MFRKVPHLFALSALLSANLVHAAAFEARLAAGVASRRLRLEPHFAELEPEYTLTLAPSLSLELRGAPFHDADDLRARVAVVGSLSGARAVTTGSSGRMLETRIWHWDAGLRMKLVDEPELGLETRLGGHSFEVEPDPRLGNWVAGTDYRFVRVGLELRVPLGDEPYLRAAVGHRFVSSTGELSDGAHLPGVTAVGRDAELALGTRLSDELGIYLAARYVRYSLSAGSLAVGHDEHTSLALGLSVASTERPEP